MQALQEYETALSQTPARVVIHKSSLFRNTEIEGFSEVLDHARVRHRDFVSVTNTDLRLFSDKGYHFGMCKQGWRHHEIYS